MKHLNMLVNTADKTAHISPELYGHFAEHLGRCIYDGIYVGEDSPIPNIHGIRRDVIEVFRQIHMPVLRWPGGCFSDTYHWKDGIGRKEDRPPFVNHTWGSVTEDNSFGTHEFMELCALVGCEPYIAGNVGTGTPQELSDWVEYITYGGSSPMADLRRKNGREAPWKLKYLGIGNEAWGGGGNMTPEYYAGVYRQFRTFCRDFSGNQLFPIACGPNAGDCRWTEAMMKNLRNCAGWQAKGLALHYYAVPDWNHKGSAAGFDEAGYYTLLSAVNRTDELLTRHTEIMNRYDADNEVALIVDEWGTWYDTEPGTNPAFLYQQNTVRDALAAALSLNIFNRHAKRVKMANLAQSVNVLQALVLTQGEKLVVTPTCHVFDLFKAHQDGDAVYCYAENENLCAGTNTPMLSSSASVKDGVLTLTLANCSLHDDAEISCQVCGLTANSASARILHEEVHACNDFDAPDRVQITAHPVSLSGGLLSVTLPPCSVAEITVK